MAHLNNRDTKKEMKQKCAWGGEGGGINNIGEKEKQRRGKNKSKKEEEEKDEEEKGKRKRRNRGSLGERKENGP